MVEAGTRLGAPQVAALAAAGVAEVRVSQRPRAAVLATGSELRRPGEPLEPGQIYDANGVLIEAQLASAGAAVERLSTSPTTRTPIGPRLARGLEADVLVTSGGVSVGPHDLVRRIEAELGVEEVFWGVSVKPGKPISFGVADGRRLVFGLPGNPVSVLVGFELFVRPAVLALQGVARSAAAVRARAAERASSSGIPRVTSSCAAALRSVEDEASCRAASRAGVAHDREGGAGRCARARAARRGPPPAAAIRSSSCVCPSGARRPACAPRERDRPRAVSDGPSHESAPEPEPRPLSGCRIRRVAAGDRCRQLSGDGEPGRRHEQRRKRHVADRGQLCEVPRRVEAEVEAQSERADEQERPAEAGDEHRRRAGAARLWRSCGSQIQAWSDGSRNSTEYGFIATTSSESTARASRAPTWPASSSASATGRRGSSRSRPTSQPPASSAP